jgi:hypothetical protein
MNDVPFLDPGLRSLHTSLESFGAQAVPAGEAALAELLDRLPDLDARSDVRSDVQRTMQRDLKRRSRRNVRRVLAIAAALVVFGGSAFAAVGGLGSSALDGLFRRHPVTVAPTPVSLDQDAFDRGHGGSRIGSPPTPNDTDVGSRAGDRPHDGHGEDPTATHHGDSGEQPGEDEQGSGGEDQQGDDGGGSGEDQQGAGDQGGGDQGEDGDDQGSGGQGDQGQGDQGQGDQGQGDQGQGDQGSGEGGDLAAPTHR